MRFFWQKKKKTPDVKEKEILDRKAQETEKKPLEETLPPAPKVSQEEKAQPKPAPKKPKTTSKPQPVIKKTPKTKTTPDVPKKSVTPPKSASHLRDAQVKTAEKPIDLKPDQSEARKSDTIKTPSAKAKPPPTPKIEKEMPDVKEPSDTSVEDTQKRPSWFSRLKTGLGKTRQSLGSGLSQLLRGKLSIDDELVDEIETYLLQADVGVEVTDKIIESLEKTATNKNPDHLMTTLKTTLREILMPCQQALEIDRSQTPYVILMVGVNGAGKTTTIAKLAQKFKSEGLSVMLAAGDTFRAAAVEQLQSWGQKLNVPVIAQSQGSDSASVIFDALSSAKSKGCDVLIADTAGRLHTKHNLMQELEKIIRVIKKFDPTAPHETCLVLDAGTGQNALIQAAEFHKTAPLNSLILTKLDGTAKGGIIFALCEKFQLPIRYIGVGESAEDLQAFEAEAFCEALFER